MVALRIGTKLVGCSRSNGNVSFAQPHAEFPSGLTNKDQKLELTLYSLFSNVFY